MYSKFTPSLPKIKKLMRLGVSLSLVFGAFLTSCKNNSSETVTPVVVSKTADKYSNEVAVKWADLNLYLVKNTANFTPPVASRALGYAGLTMYEAVVPGITGHQSLAGQLTGLSTLPKVDATLEYNWAIALNSAEYTILKSLFSTTSDANKLLLDSLKNNLESVYKQGTTQAVTDRSIAFGTSIANAIFTWSKTDGGADGVNTNFPSSYVVPVGVGLWETTENGKKIPMQPYWGKNRRFVPANTNNPTPTIIPFSYNSNSDYFKQYLAVYQKNISLTQTEKEISIWWADDPGVTFTPPGHSYNIAKILVANDNSNLGKSVEVFARVGIAVADAFMGCWKCKFTYNNIRPYNYVRQTIDPNWVPFWPAPPFPGFSSGHATQSAAAGVVLIAMFGDNVTFTDNSFVGRAKDVARNTEFKARTFTKISDVAIEAANSRFYGGIHTKQDNEAGFADGSLVGKNVNALKFTK